MKCVQSPTPDNDGNYTILRLHEHEAKARVAAGWHYVPKSIYKRWLRPAYAATREKAKQVVAGLRRV